MRGNIVREWESAWAVQLELGFSQPLYQSVAEGK